MLNGLNSSRDVSVVDFLFSCDRQIELAMLAEVVVHDGQGPEWRGSSRTSLAGRVIVGLC
jgi:hypothetical protein